MIPNTQETLALPAGQVLTLTATATSTGTVIRLPVTPGGGAPQSITAVAGATLYFGPYTQSERFKIICTGGTIVPTMAEQALDTDGTLAADSDNRIASQKAVKTYVDALLPLLDALTYCGVISSLATFPAANAGDVYKITAAGAIGGTGPLVTSGDMAICNTDSTSAGTYAEVGTKWDLLEEAFDTLDDIIQATAESDFLVSGASPFAWAKKTLTEVKSILGLGTAAYTASTAYVAHTAATAENDVLVGGPNPFGAWVKKTLSEFKTILGLGTAAYTASTAYDAAGTAAGIIASSISDSDTTHCPDGNSVYDALAAKAPLSSPAFTGTVTAANISPTLLCIAEKTPVNAVAATGTLTFSGQPAEEETVTIGSTTYAFQTAIGAGTAAAGVLTFTGNAVDNETVTLDTGSNERVYTFQNAIDASGVAAEGVLTLSGNAAENEEVVINTTTYRWRDQIAAIPAFETLTFSAVAANTETVTVNTTVYTFKTALTEAKASGILTAASPPTDGMRVVIGSTEYTYRDTLADPYDVLVEVSASDALDNLVAAITGGAGEGTKYGTDTDAHPTVTAAPGALDTVDVEALSIGVAGNSIASVGYGGTLTFASATLLGGLDSVANEILVEAAAEDEINNLVAAATGAAGAGTTYSTATAAHTTVTLSKTDAANILATAVTAGTAGNSIPIDETCANVAWTADASFLSGGYAAAVANDVIIGGTAELSIDSLVAAVTYDAGVGTNEGVLYGTGTVAHTTCTGAKTAADEFTATALSIGDAGNAFPTTTDMGSASWGAGTLEGGEGVEAAYDVLIGATAEASIDNLVLAVNAGAGAGTNYGTGTVAHPTVTGSKSAADSFTATAKSVGDAGNLIDSETDISLASWTGAHLINGDDADTAYDVLIGGTPEGSIDNLVLAISAGAGEGTNYGTGTVAHTTVTAVKADTDKVVATAKTKGTAAHSIATTDSVSLANWGAGVLGSGVDGTVGVANETCADGSYLYHCTATNTVADANWRKVTLNSL